MGKRHSHVCRLRFFCSLERWIGQFLWIWHKLRRSFDHPNC